MDDESMNRYEKQLYTVFKTFDVDNEEALDRSAVHQLCDALQLEDRGAALVNTLFERRSDRVTFAQFRNGLLAVLGGTSGESVSTVPQLDPSSQHSDDDSSGREVAPKFVFGSKKYGRRSRPPRVAPVADEPQSPRSSSASRLDTEDKRARQRMRCRRSVSAMESRNDSLENEGLTSSNEVVAHTTESFEHDRRIDRDEALALCRGLHMDTIDCRLVERIFEDSGTTDTTVGEFFDRLNASLSTTIEETSASATGVDLACESGDVETEAGVPSDIILEAWERAGVQQPRRLLAELGFGAAALRPPELERALDDELRALPETPSDRRDARTLLLAAALALSRLRLELARRRTDLTTAERDKLRGDVTEANRRARLLAQEVDESHARIEAELKASVRRAETRQAEMTRQFAAESTAERERTGTIRAKLEAEISRRADLEVRLRADLDALRERADELELRAGAAEERALEGERERARLTGELRTALERNAAAAMQGGQSAELATRLAMLQDENKQLRDRNDELCAALEPTTRRSPPPPTDTTRGGDLSAELNSLMTQECDSSPASMEQKTLGQTDAEITIQELLETVNSVPFSSENICSSCLSLNGLLRQLKDRVSEIDAGGSSRCHIGVQADATEADETKHNIKIVNLEQKHNEEKTKLTTLIKDLETSLDQMKSEYEKCEDYWSGKLEEEREAYNEEQRLGDERLSELVSKIGEYERQFANAATALPTIDERHSLEEQFTDLEEEFTQYRRDKEAELQTASAENARLSDQLVALERRLAASTGTTSPGPRRRPRDCEPTRPSVAGGAEVRELRARCARAEAAVRRLHAHLAAADVLVKDLYVENCQLAHRRPL